MKDILVALDGSESASRALALAADVALRYGATLHRLKTAVLTGDPAEELLKYAREQAIRHGPARSRSDPRIVDGQCLVEGQQPGRVSSVDGPVIG